MEQTIQVLETSLIPLSIILALALVGHFLFYRILLKITDRSKTFIDNSLIKHCYHSVQWIAVILIIRMMFPLLSLDENETAKHIVSILIIALVSYLLVKATYVLDDFVLNQFDISERDNLKARKIHTQLRVLKRILIILVSVLAIGTMLMTFDRIKQLGTTILASAGIIGIVIGMAAQRTIGTFIAGLQIAFTQPIRIDDVVIVENEWGRIEEITLTYVVVKIWDLRRLVVPITYFIEKPFQNWTRQTSDLLGTAYLYVDYSIPISEIREQLHRILKASEHWDGKVCVLQVTNASEKTVELRALMSAKDASTAWTLRCEVREKLIEYVRNNYPQSLPKVRAEIKQP